MSLITAVSFDADGIRTVTGKRNGNAFVLSRMLFLTNDELENFLKDDRCGEYLVCLNSPDAIYDTITIPPVTNKLVSGIVKSEMRRLHPELPEFSCAYRVIGDIPQDGKTVRKISCCLITCETLAPYLEPFIRANKKISRLMTAATALSTLFPPPIDEQPETIICAHDATERKTLFLLENGIVSFVRHISSDQAGWDPVDRQNISMTLDYCFQALRTRPTRTVVMNGLATEDTDNPFPRLQPFEMPETLLSIPDAADYLIPLAAVNAPIIAEDNLLPESYLQCMLRQKIVSSASLAFATVAAVIIALLTYHLFTVNSLGNEIKEMRQHETGLLTTHREYFEAKSALDAFNPLIAAQNTIMATPSIPDLLLKTGNLKQDRMTFSTITLKQESGSIMTKLSGSISGTSFADVQQSFDALTAKLKKINGITISATNLDQKTGLFTIDSVYKP